MYEIDGKIEEKACRHLVDVIGCRAFDECWSFLKKALLYAAFALVATGCIPGETVVTVTAADVECAMTGGVARAEVVMVLTNSVPAIDLKKMPERVLEKLKLSATNSSVDATLKILKPIEESLVAFMPPGDTIKLSAQPDGTNVLLCAHIRQTAFFSIDTNKLEACHFQNLRLRIDEKGKLDFFVDTSFNNQREMLFYWIGHALCQELGIDVIEKWGIGCLHDSLGNPFIVKTRKVRITGEGASKFKVDGIDGIKILHADAQVKPTLSTK